MGRFLLGFAIGAGIGVVAALVLTPRTGNEARSDLETRVRLAIEGGRQQQANLSLRVREAVAIGREAAVSHEKTAWEELRARTRPA
jgi:gas vesicle protein